MAISRSYSTRRKQAPQDEASSGIPDGAAQSDESTRNESHAEAAAAAFAAAQDDDSSQEHSQSTEPEPDASQASYRSTDAPSPPSVTYSYALAFTSQALHELADAAIADAAAPPAPAADPTPQSPALIPFADASNRTLSAVSAREAARAAGIASTIAGTGHVSEDEVLPNLTAARLWPVVSWDAPPCANAVADYCEGSQETETTEVCDDGFQGTQEACGGQDCDDATGDALRAEGTSTSDTAPTAGPLGTHEATTRASSHDLEYAPRSASGSPASPTSAAATALATDLAHSHTPAPSHTSPTQSSTTPGLASLHPHLASLAATLDALGADVRALAHVVHANIAASAGPAAGAGMGLRDDLDRRKEEGSGEEGSDRGDGETTLGKRARKDEDEDEERPRKERRMEAGRGSVGL